MPNRRRKCEIASKYTKTAGQISVDIAERTVTPALVTSFEGVKIDICSSLLLFIQCICQANVAYRKVISLTHNVGLRITAPFVFLSDVFCSFMTLLI